jgi:protein ImuB
VRSACLLVPDMPLAAELRAHPELAGNPLAVADGPGPRAELIAVSPEAARRGVRPRISATHARTVCSALCVQIASPALEQAARAALLDAALSCSPRAALAPRASGAYAGEAAAYLDASGVVARFASEAGFAAALTARARKLGLPAGVAVASSRSIAHIAARKLARSGDARVLPPGSESDFLAPLPLDLLDPDDALAERLTHFGLCTVGDLLALPQRALGTRLGPEVLELIARARGEECELPLPAPAPRALTEAIDLDFPCDRLEPLCFVLQGLLSRLLARLEARHLACDELTLDLALEGGGNDVRRVGVAAPTLDLRVLVRLLRQALEARPPDTGVEGASLATEGSAVRGDQLDLFRPAGPAPAVLGRTLAELEALCGSSRIGAPEVADDHRPEAFALGRFAPSPERVDPQRATAPRPTGAGGEPLRGPVLAVRALRPPVAAQVRIFQGWPDSIRSAVANGRVVRLAGPWRTTGGWWVAAERFAYDCFDIQTSDGTVSRLRFDCLRRTWQIDAVYD